jgi:hypothetical protein
MEGVFRNLDPGAVLRVRLRMSSIADTSVGQAPDGQECYRLGDIDAAFVIAHEASVTRYPAEPALGHAGTRPFLAPRLSGDRSSPPDRR